MHDGKPQFWWIVRIYWALVLLMYFVETLQKAVVTTKDIVRICPVDVSVFRQQHHNKYHTVLIATEVLAS